MELTGTEYLVDRFSSVQLFSRVRLFVTLWTAAHQASLFIINCQSLLKLIESVMPSNHLILCCPLLLLPSIFPSIRVFSNDQFFASGGQSIGVSASASVFPMNIQDWFPLGLTGLISLQSLATPWSWQINSHIFSGSLEGTKVRKNTSHLGGPEVLLWVC